MKNDTNHGGPTGRTGLSPLEASVDKTIVMIATDVTSTFTADTNQIVPTWGNGNIIETRTSGARPHKRGDNDNVITTLTTTDATYSAANVRGTQSPFGAIPLGHT